MGKSSRLVAALGLKTVRATSGTHGEGVDATPETARHPQRPLQTEAEDLALQRGKQGVERTKRNAPDRIRTGDLRLERPTLFGPPKGPVDH